ncbi:MAG: AbrB/MazE/SpoVT family DNA-binding domain-containing protein [Bosea sp. (in: a-proteobacteria)]
MSDIATLSAKFQISIPKAVREKQHWGAGQRFVFIPKGAGVLMVPAPDRAALTGLAKGANNTDYRDRLDRF